MQQLRRLCQLNSIAYVCFLLYLLLGLMNGMAGKRIYLICIPAIALFMTLFSLTVKSLDSMACIKKYGILDFSIRCVGFSLCILSHLFASSRFAITVQFFLLITIFSFNLSLEKIMSVRLLRCMKTQGAGGIDKDERQPVVLSIGVSYIETILLFYMMLLPFNLLRGKDISYYIIWICTFLILLILYVRQTVQTLYRYYGKESLVRHTVFTENICVVVLFVGLCLYGYTYGFATFADGLFYLSALLLLLPRQISRLRRLAAYNERIRYHQST